MLIKSKKDFIMLLAGLITTFLLSDTFAKTNIMTQLTINWLGFAIIVAGVYFTIKAIEKW
jgi:hypothetical protein